MCITISLLSQKGGVGKSTLTMMLLNALYHKKGLRVLLIDADYPQLSIFKKRQRELYIVQNNPTIKKRYDKIYTDRSPYPIVQCQLTDVKETIEQHRMNYDIIFVDISGTINQPGIVDFFQAINYFFIPIFEDDLSIYSSMELYNILMQQVQPISNNFRGCKVLFNRVHARNQIQSIKEQLSEICFMEQEVGAYKLYERFCRSTVFPMPRKKETEKFYRFVDDFLQVIQLEADPLISVPTV